MMIMIMTTTTASTSTSTMMMMIVCLFVCLFVCYLGHNSSLFSNVNEIPRDSYSEHHNANFATFSYHHFF